MDNPLEILEALAFAGTVTITARGDVESTYVVTFLDGFPEDSGLPPETVVENPDLSKAIVTLWETTGGDSGPLGIPDGGGG